MMTTEQKQEIVALIEAENSRLQSYRKVATKCQVSPATISNMINLQWTLIADEMWAKVASKLGYKPGSWSIVETVNYRMITKILDDAKSESMFMAISYPAGSGKTATLTRFTQNNMKSGVFLVQCSEWSRREFLLHLSTSLGIETGGSGYVSIDKLGLKITEFFKERAYQQPLLLLDEADKLKPSALRYLIPLFNHCEDILGVVIAGTENLEKEIKRGVRHARKGFDEIDSRFGRKFVNELVGATFGDISKICDANGLSGRDAHKRIFEECNPRQKNIGGQFVQVVEDLRRVKRAIKRELLAQPMPTLFEPQTA